MNLEYYTELADNPTVKEHVGMSQSFFKALRI